LNINAGRCIHLCEKTRTNFTIALRSRRDIEIPCPRIGELALFARCCERIALVRGVSRCHGPSCTNACACKRIETCESPDRALACHSKVFEIILLRCPLIPRIRFSEARLSSIVRDRAFDHFHNFSEALSSALRRRYGSSGHGLARVTLIRLGRRHRQESVRYT